VRKPPELVIQDLQASGEASPANILSSLKAHGYHLVSDVTIEVRDEPPIDDDRVDSFDRQYSRFGEPGAQRSWHASVVVDGVKLYFSTSIQRWHLCNLRDADGFVAHTRRRLVMELMSHLSERLGGGSFV